jgi:iron complex outermembrane recepter protein
MLATILRRLERIIRGNVVILRLFCRERRLWLVGVSIVTLFVSTDVISAEQQKKVFDIEAQKLSKALILFSEQSDLVFVTPVALIKGKKSAVVKGYMVPADALSHLLSGSGLVGEVNDAGLVSIKAMAPAIKDNGEQNVNKNKPKRSLLASVFKSITTLVTGVLATASVSNVAVAQEGGALEEVIVTAQHRAENIQDVPIAVTALSGEALKKSDIFDAATISQHVPGVAYAEFAPGQALISIRGITSADDGAGLENSTAMFLDGVYIGRGAGINFDMFDLERVEVLKGPQGTLFGRNAIGGAFNVVTAKPTDELTAKIGATAGNEGIIRVQGLASGPITEKLAGKISVNHRQHDGYVDNVLLGTELQDEDQISVRGQLRLDLDSSEWLFSADYMDDDRADMGRTPVADNAPLTAIMAANGVTKPRQQASPFDGFSKREAYGVSLQGDIEFDTGTLTSITAHRHNETDWEMQSVGAGLGAIGLPFDEVVDDIVEDIDTYSQELRWTSNLDGNINYTAGFFYFHEETDRVEQFKITAAGTYAGFTQTAVGSQAIIGNEYTRTQNETNSYAVYGQGNWEFRENWNLIVGGRFTYDEKDYQATAVDCGALPATGPFAGFPNCAGLVGSLNIINETFSVSPSDNWDEMSYKVAVQYFPNDDVMVYGSVTTGYKAGGFAGSQGVQASASTPVNPETAINYEMGFKGDLFDNTLRLNMTGYYTDYEDLQIVRFGPVAGSAFGTFQTTNLGQADIYGVEVEWGWYPTDNLRFLGNFAYMDTEVTGLVIVGVGGPVDASGSNLRQAPEVSWNGIVGYTLPTAMGTFDFQIEYSYMDEQINDYLDQRTVVQQHELLDARIAWTSNDEKWEVAVWGKNLTEEDYISHSYVIGPGVIGVWGPPQTYGITASYSY